METDFNVEIAQIQGRKARVVNFHVHEPCLEERVWLECTGAILVGVTLKQSSWGSIPAG